MRGGMAHSAVAVNVIAGYYAITTGAEVGGHRYLRAPLIGPPPVRLDAAGLGTAANGSVRKHVTGRVMEGKVKRFEGAREVAGGVEGVDGETALEPKTRRRWNEKAAWWMRNRSSEGMTVKTAPE